TDCVLPRGRRRTRVPERHAGATQNHLTAPKASSAIAGLGGVSARLAAHPWQRIRAATGAAQASDRITADIQSLAGKPEDRQPAELQTNGTRFRGYTSEPSQPKIRAVMAIGTTR